MILRVKEAVFLERSYAGSVRGLYTEVWFSPAIMKLLFSC